MQCTSHCHQSLVISLADCQCLCPSPLRRGSNPGASSCGTADSQSHLCYWNCCRTACASVEKSFTIWPLRRSMLKHVNRSLANDRLPYLSYKYNRLTIHSITLHWLTLSYRDLEAPESVYWFVYKKVYLCTPFHLSFFLILPSVLRSSLSVRPPIHTLRSPIHSIIIIALRMIN